LIALEAALVPLAFVVGWLFDVRPADQLLWSTSATALGVAAAIPPLVGVLLIDRPGPWRNLIDTVDDLLVPYLRRWTWLQFAAVSAAAGLGEELLFRGVIFVALARPLGVPLALVISSLLFGALHAFTRAYVVYATLMGLYLGALLMATGNLLVPILAHAVYDFIALAYFVRWRGSPVS